MALRAETQNQSSGTNDLLRISPTNSMNSRLTPSTRRVATDFSLSLGLVLVIVFFIISGIVTYLNTRTLNRDGKLVTQTHDALQAFSEIISVLKDAETGQRGFLITEDERYLEPHIAAVARIDSALNEVDRLTADDKEQQRRSSVVRELTRVKLAELNRTIELQRSKGFNAARQLVVQDVGKTAMDNIRAQISALISAESGVRNERLKEMERAYSTAVVSGVATCLLGTVIAVFVAYLVQKSTLAQRKEDWLQTGQVGLSTSMLGELRTEQLGENILEYLSGYLGALAGALYINRDGNFRRVATFGVPFNEDIPLSFDYGDGLLGQSAKESRAFSLQDIPDGYLAIGSALGRGKPRHLLIAPFSTDNAVNAVIEFGFDRPIGDLTYRLIERASESVGAAVRAANYRQHLQNLLEETQRQAEELQAQSEELRVSNEELEEQGRALRDSQARLEEQQAELEQNNSQLEEQTQLLQAERDIATQAKSSLQDKARELEQASRYKSDFLANMSHELRTPLNSSLILAKLLADNASGNLTAEQIRYAETIGSAGNDLLSLINDILDLSKIEAGHMEVNAESTAIAQIVEDLERMFLPIANQKNLHFKIYISEETPELLTTDNQRLEQVLKNLLSNAIKFTETGEVELRIEVHPEDTIKFSVRDTGIGISHHQQEMVFEAFRQADGTTNRKYGGTGLGLSISRELTKLLGGDLTLTSEPGNGSTFTVSLPRIFSGSLDPTTRKNTAIYGSSVAAAASTGSLASDHTESLAMRLNTDLRMLRKTFDDRDILSGDRRIILIVEDDENFSRILYELAHELSFQAIVASSAEEGIVCAAQFRPHAIVLDIGLPDHSGLAVLDRLKHDARTRHIPVHVVSGNDYSHAALSLGAVGYMLKPVKREELSATLRKLESRLEQRLRRVLIVEDDPVQQESMQRLLGAHDVETVGVSSAAECLSLLESSTFDCMVLDLSLPDASGYSLLETLSKEDAYAFPPVIVYTGREMQPEEEQRLRRYSKSIIIKGAKSPERLLDEVTLFLHQVVSDLPAEQQRMLEVARNRDATLEGKRILIAEDDVRNVFALTSILEPRGALVQIVRNGRDAILALENSKSDQNHKIDLVLMDIMMPEMDGIAAIREIRRREEWKKLPIIALTAKAMKDDQEKCLSAGASDYMAKPLDVEKLLSLIRVWMPR